MKLHSKFRDFYDSSLRFGSSDRHFVRDTVEFEIENSQTFHREVWVHSKATDWYGDSVLSRCLQFRLLVFCGKVIPFVSFYRGFGESEGGVWSFESLAAMLPEVLDYDNGEVSAKSIKAWFETPSYKSVFDYNPKFFTDILLKRRIAYYVAGEVVPRKLPNGEFSRVAFYRQGVQYPLLKGLEFQKTMNPFLCFQDIEMFLNNDIALPDSPRILPVPDKIKAESHGFDKYSFRKAKSS